MKTSEHRRAIVARSREKNKHKYVQKKRDSYKDYYKANHALVRAKQAVYKEKHKEKINKQICECKKKRLRNDPVFKLQCLMRTRIGNHLRGKCKKEGKTFQLIGCTPAQLAVHLKGSGEIDHIFPLTRYGTDEQHKMTRWENLQRLSKEENNWKNDRLPTKAMAAKVPRTLWPYGVSVDELPDIYPGWATGLNKY